MYTNSKVVLSMDGKSFTASYDVHTPFTCCLRGGSGYNTCAILTGPDFERGKWRHHATRSMYPEQLATVFYKNELSMSTTYLNLYMIYGGTNWGGIAYPGVYTSYDYVRTLGLAVLRFALYPHPRVLQLLKTVHSVKNTTSSSYKPTSSASARPISRRGR